ISEQNGALASLPQPAGIVGARNLNGTVVGTHGLEELEGRGYRWTEPVALMRLSFPADGALLRIDTGGLRGDPASYLNGIYAGRRRLAPELITSDGRTLQARLPAKFAQAAEDRGLVLLCRPLVPARSGSSDR